MKIGGLIHLHNPKHTRIKLDQDGRTFVLTGEELNDLMETVDRKRYVMECQHDPKEYIPEFLLVSSENKGVNFSTLKFEPEFSKAYEK
jgi:hypothetical protein